MDIKSTQSALYLALHGVQKGLRDLGHDAARIASTSSFNNSDPAGLAQPLVDAMQHALQIEASAKVITTVDRVIGSLLDSHD